jgi:hypothetical protein
MRPPAFETPLSLAPAILAAGGLALAACGGREQATTPVPPPQVACSPAVAAMPTVHVGPDLTMRALCGTTTRGAVASVDERGNGVTRWSLSLQGDPAFFVMPAPFETCQSTSPTVALVQFAAPPDALPGATYAAVVTVHADDGSFPDGKVNVSAEVVSPSITVDTSTLDFGDVPLGVTAMRAINFNAPDEDVTFRIDSAPNSTFVLTMQVGLIQRLSPNLHSWNVSFHSDAPGDYTTSMTWTASPARLVSAPPPCTWRATIPMHARVLPPDAGQDDSSDDSSDGASDGAGEGPDAP